MCFFGVSLGRPSGTSRGPWIASPGSHGLVVCVQALERGVVFEVTYAAAIRDSTMRRYTIANANMMMDVCKGKVRLSLVSGRITGTPAVTRLCFGFFPECDPVQCRWDCESALKKNKARQIRQTWALIIISWHCVFLGSGAQRALWCHQSVSLGSPRPPLRFSPMWRNVCESLFSLTTPPRGLLFGLSDGDAKEATSSTCRSAVLHAGNTRRRCRAEVLHLVPSQDLHFLSHHDVRTPNLLRRCFLLRLVKTIETWKLCVRQNQRTTCFDKYVHLSRATHSEVLLYKVWCTEPCF